MNLLGLVAMRARLEVGQRYCMVRTAVALAGV
jgi:hypothetical protein